MCKIKTSYFIFISFAKKPSFHKLEDLMCHSHIFMLSCIGVFILLCLSNSTPIKPSLHRKGRPD